MNIGKAIFIPLLMLSVTETGLGSGHGPVFSLATPTNVRGGWSLDIGTTGRVGTLDSGVMSRAMFSYGITQDIQISVSAPAVFSSALLAPGRVTAMLPATGDFEALGTWRFRRRDIGVGSRIETTAYGGIILPGSQKPRVDRRAALGTALRC